SGPIPSSLNPNSSTGREKTQIHQKAATKYPTEGAYFVKNKYFVPNSEKLTMPANTASEAIPKPVTTASSRVFIGSLSKALKTVVSAAIPKIHHRNRNSAATTNEARGLVSTGGA